MKLTCLKFSDLGPAELYEILQLRQRVFVVEQKCAYLDADGIDPQCLHLMLRQEGKLVAYLRIVPPGVKYAEPSIGRVVSSPEARGTGVGKFVMAEAMRTLRDEYGKTAVRINAQAYLKRFYEEFGFQDIGKPNLEDDIPHLEMLKGAD